MDPKNLKYAKTHEWVAVENGIATVGITDHAQTELGDITYMELPGIGREVKQGEEMAVIESVKAASDVVAPLGGKVSEVNSALEDEPEIINEDPYGEGWICRIGDCDESGLDSLMSPEEYEEFLAEA